MTRHGWPCAKSSRGTCAGEGNWWSKPNIHALRVVMAYIHILAQLVLLGIPKYYRAPPRSDVILQRVSVIFPVYLGTTGTLSHRNPPYWSKNARWRTSYSRNITEPFRGIFCTSVIFSMGWYSYLPSKTGTSVMCTFWTIHVDLLAARIRELIRKQITINQLALSKRD